MKKTNTGDCKATHRIYYDDSCVFDFDAKVIGCEKDVTGNFAIVLDRTAFFPESGGQYGDCGFIGSSHISNTKERNNVIFHMADRPVEVGLTLQCKIDRDARFIKMQNHSGEHIVSGLIYSRFGIENVGFHLGHYDVTMDFNKKISREQLDCIEEAANDVVYRNLPIEIFYPDEDELAKLSYRSKLDITDNVRIVKIGDVDTCACCAPHVRMTGEIGIIKLLDYAPYKGGTRVHMLCGKWALSDYGKRYSNLSEIAALLSSKSDETSEKFKFFLNEKKQLELKLSMLKKSNVALKAEKLLPDSEGNIIVFEVTEADVMQDYVNVLLAKCENIAAVFSGDDKNGYNFIIASEKTDLKSMLPEFFSTFNVKCGGSKSMIRGFICAEKAKIIDFTKKMKAKNE